MRPITSVTISLRPSAILSCPVWLVRWLLLVALTLMVVSGCAPTTRPASTTHSAPKLATPQITPPPIGATAVPVADAAAQLRGWTLVWYDEFNGSHLDATKWTVVNDAPGGYHNCCLGNTLNAWVAGDVSLVGDNLRLTTERRSFQGHTYTSGAVTTEGKFDFFYGRLDIRARLPKGDGIWPAFWLLPTDTSQFVDGFANYEVDMMEYLGQDPHTDYMVDWVGARNRYCVYSGPDLSATYHVYSFIWTPTSITWLIDGVQRCQFHQGMPTTRMYLILNDRIGGSWPVPPDTSTVLPQYTDIDYVRVYTVAITRPTRLPPP